MPASSKGPAHETIRHGHCADNPKRKKGATVQDYLGRDEIDAIAENEFSKLKNLPCLGHLSEFDKKEQYDRYIQGWTKYWNEVLQPKTPLDPNIIKALIASESSYNPNVKPQDAGIAGKARGFIQLTDQARHILSDPNGEMKNHYVKTNQSEATDPNMSICAGIRWLHYKQKQATHDLGREAAWVEAVEKYKGTLMKSPEKKNKELNQFYKNYNELKKICALK